jgi:hypothetical protein
MRSCLYPSILRLMCASFRKGDFGFFAMGDFGRVPWAISGGSFIVGDLAEEGKLISGNCLAAVQALDTRSASARFLPAYFRQRYIQSFGRRRAIVSRRSGCVQEYTYRNLPPSEVDLLDVIVTAVSSIRNLASMRQPCSPGPARRAATARSTPCTAA